MKAWEAKRSLRNSAKPLAPAAQARRGFPPRRRSATPGQLRRRLVVHLDSFAEQQIHRRCLNISSVLLAANIRCAWSAALCRDISLLSNESGTLFFRHGPITIDIHREPQPEKRPHAGSPFVGAREQVVHALHAGR